MIVSDLPGFPHNEVTLRGLTVGDVMRAPEVLSSKAALLSAIMSPKMSVAEIEALPLEALASVAKILKEAEEASGLVRLAEAAEQTSPPA